MLGPSCTYYYPMLGTENMPSFGVLSAADVCFAKPDEHCRVPDMLGTLVCCAYEQYLRRLYLSGLKYPTSLESFF